MTWKSGVEGHSWPNFFIVGAQKGGTTSLYEYLRCQSQVYMSPMKEPHYFSADRVRMDRDLVVTKEGDYLRLFRGSVGAKAVGEASPSYLWHPDVPGRIRGKSPQARIIILLRDPIERAYSQYLMDILDGGVTRSFYRVMTEGAGGRGGFYGTGSLYVDLGLYHEQVRRYLDTFGRSRVLVLMSENLFAAPVDAVVRVMRFLGLGQESPINISGIGELHLQYLRPRNSLIPYLMRLRRLRVFWRSAVPARIRQRIRAAFLVRASAKPELDPKARELLQSIYEPDIERLEELLGRETPSLRKTWRRWD